MTKQTTTVDQLNGIMFGAFMATVFLTVTIIAMGSLKNRLADEHDASPPPPDPASMANAN